MLFRETMEQSSDRPVTSDEIEVAGVLLELRHLIVQSQSRPRFSFTWGAKRRRSADSKHEFAAVSVPALEPSSPSPAPPLLPPNVVGSNSETEGPTEFKVLTSSPATPLSFSPSDESDEKPLPSKKKAAAVNSLKRKKEQLLEIMEDFTRRNELLKKNIEDKKKFIDQQKAQNNFMLKAKNQMLSHQISLRKVEEEPPRLKSLKLEIRMESTEHSQHRIPPTRLHHQPFVVDQTVPRPEEANKISQYPHGRTISWLQSNTEGLNNMMHDNVGPLGHLDLNVSLVEEAYASSSSSFTSSKPFDLNTTAKSKARAAAAEARFKRMQICRSKNYNASSFKAARYPLR